MTERLVAITWKFTETQTGFICLDVTQNWQKQLTQHPPNDSKYRIDDKKALEVIFGYIFNGNFVYIFMSVFAISKRKIYLTSSQIHPLDVKRIQTNKKKQATYAISCFLWLALTTSSHVTSSVPPFTYPKFEERASIFFASSFFKDVNRLLLFYISSTKVRKKLSNPRRNFIVAVTGYSESIVII